MGTLNKYILRVVVVCCCTMFSGLSYAKVCFLADGDCLGATSIGGGYTDPADETKAECIAAGYDTEAKKCLEDITQQITEYCPYNSQMVKCCSRLYAYNTCTYPLVRSGDPYKCGTKYKCQCDPDVYKYPSISACSSAGYKKAIPGGAACSYAKSVATSGTIDYELTYKDCTCDRGLYPYSAADCAMDDKNAEVAGDPCISSITDSDGQYMYYPACKCDTAKYPYTNDSCEFGGSTTAGHCVQSGIWYFQNCCSCKKYPAQGTREDGPDDPHVDTSRGIKIGGYTITVSLDLFNKVFGRDEDEKISEVEALYNTWKSKIPGVTLENFYTLVLTSKPLYYDECPCAKGYNRFKINRCKMGYQPNSEGSACQPISCENATKLYLAQNSSNYALWKGGSVFYKYALQYDESGIVKLDAKGVPLFTETTVDRNVSPLVASNLTVSNSSCSSTGYGIGCGIANYYRSSQYVANDGGNAAMAIMRESCTTPPKLTFSGSSFPSNANSTYGIYMYGIDLHFSSTTSVKRYLYMYNSVLSGSYSTVTFDKKVYLYRNSNPTNYNDTAYNIPTSTFKDGLYSDQYDFNISTLNIEIPTNKNETKITLAADQQISGGSVYVYPTADTYTSYSRNNGNRFPAAKNSDYTMKIVGPSGSTSANIYSNFYLGFNSSNNKRSRNVFLSMDGHTRFYMYGPSGTKYNIGLSSGSKIYSNNYNTGNFSRIMFSTSNVKKECYMRDSICYIVNRKSGWSCATKRCDWDSEYFLACSISSTSALSSRTPTTGEYSCRSKDCGCRTTSFRTGCKIEYSYHDTNENDAYNRGYTPGPVMFCN